MKRSSIYAACMNTSSIVNTCVHLNDFILERLYNVDVELILVTEKNQHIISCLVSKKVAGVT